MFNLVVVLFHRKHSMYLSLLQLYVWIWIPYVAIVSIYYSKKGNKSCDKREKKMLSHVWTMHPSPSSVSPMTWLPACNWQVSPTLAEGPTVQKGPIETACKVFQAQKGIEFWQHSHFGPSTTVQGSISSLNFQKSFESSNFTFRLNFISDSFIVQTLRFGLNFIYGLIKCIWL